MAGRPGTHGKNSLACSAAARCRRRRASARAWGNHQHGGHIGAAQGLLGGPGVVGASTALTPPGAGVPDPGLPVPVKGYVGAPPAPRIGLGCCEPGRATSAIRNCTGGWKFGQRPHRPSVAGKLGVNRACPLASTYIGAWASVSADQRLAKPQGLTTGAGRGHINCFLHSIQDAVHCHDPVPRRVPHFAMRLVLQCLHLCAWALGMVPASCVHAAGLDLQRLDDQALNLAACDGAGRSLGPAGTV